MYSGPDFKKFIEIDVPSWSRRGAKDGLRWGSVEERAVRNTALNASSLSSKRASRLGDSDLVNDVADFNSAI